MAEQTGNGATLTFGTTAVWSSTGLGTAAAGIKNYTSIGGISPSRDDLEVTDLQDVPAGDDASVYKRFVPGDTVDGGEITVQGFWEPAGGLPPVLEAPETFTTTYADSGAATIAFTGYVKSFSISEAVNDQLLMIDMVIKVAGTPTFTA